MTDEQQGLANAARRALTADPHIEAAWLSGSLGRGEGDAFSDVDVMALVRDASASEVGLRHGRDVSAIAEPLLVTVLFGGRVVSVVTADWGRFDISFVEAGELERYDGARLTPLFNKGRRSPPTHEPVAYRPSPDAVLKLVNEFLRVLGLLVVGVGREEWILSVSGTEILRQLCVDLMLEENGVGPGDRGGALSRNRLLTVEQRRTLEALSPIAANRQSVIAADIELAAVFLPRARTLVERVGADWPSAFEAATRRHLQEKLGLILP